MQACHFCLAENTGAVFPAAGDDCWLQYGPETPRLYPCAKHWVEICNYGVDFDADGVPSIRRARPLPALRCDRLLPLIEQLMAREWLLERSLDAHRAYVTLLEGEPMTDAEMEAHIDRINDAERELEKGPVRT